jgi:hypothetical protein
VIRATRQNPLPAALEHPGCFFRRLSHCAVLPSIGVYLRLRVVTAVVQPDDVRVELVPGRPRPPSGRTLERQRRPCRKRVEIAASVKPLGDMAGESDDEIPAKRRERLDVDVAEPACAGAVLPQFHLIPVKPLRSATTACPASCTAVRSPFVRSP